MDMVVVGHTASILSLAFDGYNILASGAGDKSIKLWK